MLSAGFYAVSGVKKSSALLFRLKVEFLFMSTVVALIWDRTVQVEQLNLRRTIASSQHVPRILHHLVKAASLL